jgi:hypothetical protein
VTWDPELQQLLFAPIAEQDLLRGAALLDEGDAVILDYHRLSCI